MPYYEYFTSSATDVIRTGGTPATFTFDVTKDDLKTVIREMDQWVGRLQMQL